MNQVAQPRERTPQVLDEAAVCRAIRRLGHEIHERHGSDPPLLAGVRTRGVPLALRLAGIVASLSGARPPVAALDVRDYRDDQPRPVTPRSRALSGLAGDGGRIDSRAVIVVDDVLFTGRTLRAALDALMDCGRPSLVELLVLVDRGHRELPLRAAYVGKNIPTATHQRVEVRLSEVDGRDGAWLVEEAAR